MFLQIEMMMEYEGAMHLMYACFIASLGISSSIVFVLSEVSIDVVRIMSTMQLQIDVRINVEN